MARRTVLMVCATLSLAVSAYADPLRITSGQIHIFDADCGSGCDGPSGELDFSLSGNNRSVAGVGFDFDFPFADWMFGAQDATALSSEVDFDGFLPGLLEGITGRFRFDAFHSRVACTGEFLPPECTAAGRFTFVGTISAFPEPLVGSGIATGSLSGLDYAFNASPTPEPGTLLFLTSGVCMILSSRLRVTFRRGSH